MKNYAKTAVLLAGIGGIMIVLGGLFGGRTGMFIGLALGLAFVGFSYWNSDKLAIRAAKAVPADEAEMPEYFAIVRELAAKSGIPMPRLYISPEMQPNAFATGRNPEHAAVAVTQGILRVLTWEELRGVLAHELGHVKNRDILISSVAAAVAMGITVIATMARFAAIFGGRGNDRDGGNVFAMLAMAILAPLAAGILQAALSRTREFEADATGKALIGDGAPLASALAKIEAAATRVPMDIDPAHAQAFIVNPLTGRKVQFANLFRTHPPTEERIARLTGR
ncbi:MAG TPA: zinc metalloprotease HtpX [Acidimicrobiales bacterium]|nr:zinc metalloprotease HtpX [Acidimicrobiales bacterium]